MLLAAQPLDRSVPQGRSDRSDLLLTAQSPDRPTRHSEAFEMAHVHADAWQHLAKNDNTAAHPRRLGFVYHTRYAANTR